MTFADLIEQMPQLRNSESNRTREEQRFFDRARAKLYAALGLCEIDQAQFASAAIAFLKVLFDAFCMRILLNFLLLVKYKQ